MTVVLAKQKTHTRALPLFLRGARVFACPATATMAAEPAAAAPLTLIDLGVDMLEAVAR
jgi:hypothetical protein